jgi:hypothetical protein
MKRFVASILILGAGMLLAAQGAVAAEELEKFKGRIVGEKCAKLGKIGECYLKWANPMVFFTEDGDYYAIERVGLAQERLDEAFGQEVEVQGQIVDDRVRIVQLSILNPLGGKEFFKG